jgi:hypothetical protein
LRGQRWLGGFSPDFNAVLKFGAAHQTSHLSFPTRASG